MKKCFAIFLSLFTAVVALLANDAPQIKYFGQYVSYTTPRGVKQKSLGEIIALKNNEITFYSHKRCRNYLFTRNGDRLEFKIKKSTNRLFYDRSADEYYFKKPGKWFFFPEKIIYVHITTEVAEKQISEWQ